MFKKDHKEEIKEGIREELKMWNIIKRCFENGEVDIVPFHTESCEEGGLDIFHVAGRMNLNFDETIKNLDRLKAHKLIKYMVSPSYIFMRKGWL